MNRRAARPSLLMSLAVLALGTTCALAAVPATPRFDLAAPTVSLVTEKSLHDRRHVMQSFAFDPRNGEIYAVQVEGADDAGTWEQHDHRGDLTLTRLSADGSTVLGHMFLRGFGHGVAIGVEPSDSTVFLWTEVDSHPNSDGSGRGQRLGRFAFTDGKTLEANSPAITKYTPIDGAMHTTPSIDTAHGYLAVRYVLKERFHVALFKLDAVKSGEHTPLADILCPADIGTFQGWTTWGSSMYFYTGNNYSDANPPPGNARLFCYDWNTGREVQRVRTEAFPNQSWREPEGLAVRANDAHPQLVFGFSSHVPGTNRRVISLAALEHFAP